MLGQIGAAAAHLRRWNLTVISSRERQTEFEGRRRRGEVDAGRLGWQILIGVGGGTGSAGGVVGSSSGAFGLAESDGRRRRAEACGVNARQHLRLICAGGV